MDGRSKKAERQAIVGGQLVTGPSLRDSDTRCAVTCGPGKGRAAQWKLRASRAHV